MLLLCDPLPGGLSQSPQAGSVVPVIFLKSSNHNRHHHQQQQLHDHDHHDHDHHHQQQQKKQKRQRKEPVLLLPPRRGSLVIPEAPEQRWVRVSRDAGPKEGAEPSDDRDGSPTRRAAVRGRSQGNGRGDDEDGGGRGGGGGDGGDGGGDGNQMPNLEECHLPGARREALQGAGTAAGARPAEELGARREEPEWAGFGARPRLVSCEVERALGEARARSDSGSRLGSRSGAESGAWTGALEGKGTGEAGTWPATGAEGVAGAAPCSRALGSEGEPCPAARGPPWWRWSREVRDLPAAACSGDRAHGDGGLKALMDEVEHVTWECARLEGEIREEERVVETLRRR
ncbi:uncharacterized protein LOC142905791 [Petromyzon marinus]|uniref:uncharacterized protein LOC142905791 n=1 Tax=Petromyzon marinus TaxID=7757 RepID=UPI003F71E0AA